MGYRDNALAMADEPQAAKVPVWASNPLQGESAAPEQPAGQHIASGPLEALQAGYQGSATGLAFRGRLPDVVLDPQHSKWYEKALASVGQMASEAPEMIVGAAAGGAAGTAAAGPVGTLLGGGAGAFAVPAAIRQSLIEAYTKGHVTSSGDFLNRASIVLKETGKEAAIGAATFGAGGAAARIAGKALAPAIGEALTIPAARSAIGTAQTAAEVGTMVVAPAVLDGRLPEPEDFLNAAIVVGGLKGSAAVAGRMRAIYQSTGIRPEQVVADAKADPEVAKQLAEGPPRPEGMSAPEVGKDEWGRDIPRAYDQAAEAEMLTNALPEAPKVASIIANPRGTITDGKEPNHINYRYVDAPEDVVQLRASIAENMKTEIEAARGKESWDATQTKAASIIRDRLAGMSDEQRATMAKMSFADLAAQSMAVEAMAQKAAFDARTAAQAIAEKGVEATADDHAKLVQAIETSALLHAVDQGNGAEIARALNARKAASQRAELAEGMSGMLEKYGNDPRILAKMVLGLHSSAEITRFARDAAKATTYEKVIEAWKAGILSGPVTHMANVLGNTTFMAMRPIIDLTASGIGRLTNAEERVSAAAPFGRVLGNLQGAKNALIVAGQALQAAYETGGVKGLFNEIASGTEAEGPHKAEQFRTAIEGTKGEVIRLPFRALSLADEFFKVMNDYGERYAQATDKAVGEGLNVLTSEFRERVSDLVQNDATIEKAGGEAALRFTFNTPLGEKGVAVQNLVRKAKLELLVPFIRTPANIFKEMIRMTPLAPLIAEWRGAYEAGGAERAKAISELAMGTAIGSVVASYVFDGSISGQGSPDPGKRRVASAAGWQPYSVNVDGKWYSYQRLQPLGTLMGMAADIAEVWDNLSEEENSKAATMLSVAFANAVTNQTFLQGITSIVQVLADPQRYGPRFVQNYAGSVVPALIAQPTAQYDPIQREVNGIVDAVKARLPGLRQDLQPKRDIFGEPVQTKERVGSLSPIPVTTDSTDKVRTEAERLGVSAADTPKKTHIGRGSGKMGDVKLEPEERDRYAEIGGKLAHEILEPIVNEPGWDALPDLVKKRVYEKVFKQAHRAGAMAAMTMEKRVLLLQGVSEQLSEAFGGGGTE